MTPSLVALLLLIAGGLVVCSALFSGLETALFALRRHQLRRLESNHPALAGFVQKFRENPRRVLAVILLGSALVNVFLIVICLMKNSKPWFRSVLSKARCRKLKAR